MKVVEYYKKYCVKINTLGGCHMAKIITISREFGSGGRELGKRLAESLGIPCYDQQIIEMVAKEQGLDEDYVAHVSEKDIRTVYPSTIGMRFSMYNYNLQPTLQVIAAQHKIMKELAAQGDCVIVGRCGDIILKEFNPMNIFVYADRESKVGRCLERAKGGENYSHKDVERKIKEIDRSRAELYKLFTETKWGHKEGYHLCVNTTNKEIKDLVEPLASYIRTWFQG